MGEKTRKKLIAVSICAVLFVSALIIVLVVVLSPNTQASTVPSTHDELRVQAFLLQSDGTDTNADKLEVDANNTSTWGGCFEFQAGVLRNIGKLTYSGGNLISIANLSAGLHGNLVLTGCADLQTVAVSANPLLTSVDVSGCLDLRSLRIEDTGITSVNLTDNTGLTILDIGKTGVSSLDISNNLSLTYLRVSDSALTALDVSAHSSLVSLYASHTSISEISVENNLLLQNLNVSNTNITSIDVSKNAALLTLSVSNVTIGALDVSENPLLRNLICNNTGITELNLINNTSIVSLAFTYTSGFILTNPGPRLGEGFEGWYSEQTEGVKVTFAPGYYIVYARWDIMKYLIVYKNAFSPPLGNPLFYVFGVGVPSFDNPARIGYTFKGWYDDEFDDTNQITQITVDDDEDKELWAHWIANKYAIIYKGVIPNSASLPVEFTYGVVFTLPILERKDYIFDGWYTEEIGGTKVNQITAGVLGSQTLWARWSPVEPEQVDFPWEFTLIFLGALLLFILLVLLLIRNSERPQKGKTGL